MKIYNNNIEGGAEPSSFTFYLVIIHSYTLLLSYSIIIASFVAPAELESCRLLIVACFQFAVVPYL